MKKLSYPIYIFLLAIIILIFLFIKDLIMQESAFFLIKKILTILMCISAIVYWCGYMKFGMIFYNLFMIGLLFIELLFFKNFIKIVIVFLIYIMLDIYQIFYFIRYSRIKK